MLCSGHIILQIFQIVLNFLRRRDVKVAAYLAILWPLMKYPSVARSQCVYKHAEERAARWTIRCYDRYNSVTTMLASLKWFTLASSTQEIARLILFYKIMNWVLVLPPYHHQLSINSKNTHHHQHLHLIKPQMNTTAYQQSPFSQEP